jgi:DNA-binding transcriptional ArsR family regulator
MTNAHPMDALGDPTRRRIFERLRGGPLAVGELAAELPVSRPAVSQHLRVLREAGLVSDRKAGTRRLYEVSPEGLGELRDWFDTFWSEALARFKAEAEREGRKASTATPSTRGRCSPPGSSRGGRRRTIP